jgi:ketosteroid isomerase-like protein
VSQTNVEVLRDHYAATNERDFRRAMAHYADDVVLVIPTGITAGTFEGREAVGAWFGDWFATFGRDARFDVEEIVELNAGSILLVAKHCASGRTSGIEVEELVIWIYRLRHGKITRLEKYGSRAEANQAAGLGV